MDNDPKLREGFSQRLQMLRQEKNMTQAELSSLSGIPQPALSLYENAGNSRLPTLYGLVRLADALKVSTDYLLCRTEEKIGSNGIVSEDAMLKELSSKDRKIILQVTKGLLAAARQKQKAIDSHKPAMPMQDGLSGDPFAHIE